MKGNCTNFRKICLLLKERKGKWILDNSKPNNKHISCHTNAQNQILFTCKEHQGIFKNASMLEKHFKSKHLEELWDIEFPKKEWDSLFALECENPLPVHKADCIAFPTSQYIIDLLKKGCLDFSGKLTAEQIEILQKGYKFVYLTKKEILKIKQQAIDFCHNNNISIDKETQRIIDFNIKSKIAQAKDDVVKMPDDVFITKADKSGILIAINKDEYNLIGENFLINSNNFVPQDNDVLQDFLTELNLLRTKWQNSEFWTEEWDHLLQVPGKLREKNIYFLLKIHKPKNAQGLIKGRPITDAIGTYTSILDKGLYSILQHVPKIFDTIIYKSLDVLQNIRDLENKNGKDFVFLTADISDMYNQIPLEEASKTIKRVLDDTDTLPKGCRTLFIEAIDLVLKYNTVQFNGKWYKQTKGIAMGASLSPFIANHWLGYLEKDLFQEIKPIYGGRYLDDILGIFRHEDLAINFAEQYEKLHNNIHLEWQISTNNANFLDIHFQNQKGKIITSIYFKPSDTIAMLHRNSAHPSHTFTGVIKSQILRFVRTNNTSNNFRSAMLSLLMSLNQRHYCWEEIIRASKETLLKCKTMKWPYIKPKSEKQKNSNDNATINIITFMPGLEKLFYLIKKSAKVAFTVYKNLKARHCRSKFVL